MSCDTSSTDIPQTLTDIETTLVLDAPAEVLDGHFERLPAFALWLPRPAAGKRTAALWSAAGELAPERSFIGLVLRGIYRVRRLLTRLAPQTTGDAPSDHAPRPPHSPRQWSAPSPARQPPRRLQPRWASPAQGRGRRPRGSCAPPHRDSGQGRLGEARRPRRPRRGAPHRSEHGRRGRPPRWRGDHTVDAEPCAALLGRTRAAARRDVIAHGPRERDLREEGPRDARGGRAHAEAGHCDHPGPASPRSIAR